MTEAVDNRNQILSEVGELFPDSKVNFLVADDVSAAGDPALSRYVAELIVLGNAPVAKILVVKGVIAPTKIQGLSFPSHIGDSNSDDDIRYYQLPVDAINTTHFLYSGEEHVGERGQAVMREIESLLAVNSELQDRLANLKNHYLAFAYSVSLNQIFCIV